MHDITPVQRSYKQWLVNIPVAYLNLLLPTWTCLGGSTLTTPAPIPTEPWVSWEGTNWRCVWDPYTDKLATNLEKVQRRAARFVLNRHRNTSSVGAMLSSIGPPSRRNVKVCSPRHGMLYKIRNDLACARVQAHSLSHRPPQILPPYH